MSGNRESLIPAPLAQKVRRLLPDSVWALGRDVVFGQTGPQRRRAQRRLARLERSQPAERHLKAVKLHGETLLALSAETFRAGETLASNARLVLDAFDAAGVEYLVIDAPTNRRRVVAVPGQATDAALAALRSAGSAHPAYASWRRGSKGGGPSVRLSMLDAPPAGVRLLQVFAAYASPTGLPLAGRDLACEVEFWRELTEPWRDNGRGQTLPAAALLAPRANRWADLVLPDERCGRELVVDGIARRGLATRAAAHQYDVTFPIDVVYTWVDGSDPAWRSKRDAAQGLSGGAGLHALAASDSRYTSRDELKYSLRSLDVNAEWVNRVFLVTDGQVPDWLDLDHPKLQMVTHEEIFADPRHLPTFNSHAIESQLHHIEGLAEHYLYLNDDVFLGRPVAPELFFQSNGVARFFPSRHMIGLGHACPDDLPVMSAAKNNRDLLQASFDVTVTQKMQHVPHAQRRSVLERLEAEFPTELASTASHRFRTDTDLSIASSLHHNYGYRLGLTTPATLDYVYTDLTADETSSRLRRMLRERNLDVFCLNDQQSTDEVSEALLGDFLERYFPVPSSFERRD